MILSDRDIQWRIDGKPTQWNQAFDEKLGHFSKLEIVPYTPVKTIAPNGMSYGLSCAGYDVRIAQDVMLRPGEFSLASTIEWIKIPTDIEAEFKDKSSWARQGLSVFNTVQEPGWYGHLTIELVNNHHLNTIHIQAGSPIGQYVFKQMSSHALNPYSGKYQGQEAKPVPFINEKQLEAARSSPT